ncbi:hybrid sensor histidine kinase/response regulator [Streptomyces cavourensis]|nr:hybrid sensor histidine kinase/response regulator [Streptomyces cavourensis]
MSTSAQVRTRGESALRLAGENRYRLLVDAVMDYQIYLLDAEGRVISLNKGAEQFKGYTLQEVAGEDFSLFYTEEDRAAGLPQRALETARREGRFEDEGWRVHKNGQRFWCSVVMDTIRDDDGSILGFAKITRDLTEKKNAQQEVEAAREALYHSQKLEALGRLTGGVAHDFNNFLTTIRFAADMLAKPTVEAPKRLELAGLIAAAVDRAGHLTAQLLAYARRQPLKPARFDVRGCIEGMQDIFAATAGAGIRIDYRFEDGPLYICADPNQLETAILNIVVNARDAMPQGGTLTISLCRANGVAGPDPAGGGRPCVAIAVRDAGSGMAPEVLAHVFEPFFSTKPIDKGTGLGLSQVFGFARQSGGDVSVSSKEGEGSTFTITIPEDALRGDIQAVQAPPADPGEAFERIVLVEDDASVAEVLRALLEDLGHEVTLCTGADQALDLLAETHGGCDMVITDIEMAGLNGIELAHRIRSMWPHIRIILTTGADDILRRSGPRVFPLLPKPWSMALLIDLLKRDPGPVPEGRAP